MTYIPIIPSTEITKVDVYRGHGSAYGSNTITLVTIPNFNSTWRYFRVVAMQGHQYRGGSGNLVGVLRRYEFMIDCQRWIWQQYHYIRRMGIYHIQYGTGNLWYAAMYGTAAFNYQVANTEDPGDSIVEICAGNSPGIYGLPYTPSSHPNFGDNIAIRAVHNQNCTWYANVLAHVYREEP